MVQSLQQIANLMDVLKWPIYWINSELDGEITKNWTNVTIHEVIIIKKCSHLSHPPSHEHRHWMCLPWICHCLDWHMSTKSTCGPKYRQWCDHQKISRALGHHWRTSLSRANTDVFPVLPRRCNAAYCRPFQTNCLHIHLRWNNSSSTSSWMQFPFWWDRRIHRQFQHFPHILKV